MVPRILLLLLGCFACAPAVTAQVIRGHLLEEETGEPVASGTMTLLTRDSVEVASVLTDSGGAFLLPVPHSGSYRLRAERIGYHAAVSPALPVGSRDTLVVEFRLSTRAVVLDPVVVTGTPRRPTGLLAGFHERARERAFGAFVTRADIERQRPYTTTDLLRRVPGVQLVPRRLGGGHTVMLRGTCAPTVYVDGIRVRLFGSTIDDLVSPQALEGIEVYRSAAEVPVEYAGMDAGCGAILLWTRRAERR